MEIHPSLWTSLLQNLLHMDLKFYDHVVAAGLVFLILLLLGLVAKAGYKKVPNKLQQTLELVVSGILGMLDENIGHGGRKYLPLIGTLAFFIFLCNFLGMIPGFSAATSNFNTTIACALIVFFYYNFEGLRENGVGYLKHFVGPIPLLAPLMIPLEIIGHAARPFSLGMRLFGNISGEHIVTLIFYTKLLPYLLPVPIMVLGLFAAFLQTFVFIMLTQIYIAGAIAHEH